MHGAQARTRAAFAFALTVVAAAACGLAACGSAHDGANGAGGSAGTAVATGGTAVATGGVGGTGPTAQGAGGAATQAGGSTTRGEPFSSYAPVGAPIALGSVVNASDIAWKAETDTFFVLADRVSQLYEYDANFTHAVRTIQLVNRPEDAEGLAYLGSNAGLDRFAVSIEAPTNSVFVIELAPLATSLDFSAAVRQRFEPIAPSKVANRGLEGIAYRPASASAPAWLYACEEGEPGQEPIRLFGFEYDAAGPATLGYQDGSLRIAEPFDAATQFGDRMGDLSGIHHDVDSNTLLVLSHLSSRLLRVEPTSGTVLDQLLLARSPQYEGVTLASGGRLVLVSEPNFIEIFRAQ